MISFLACLVNFSFLILAVLVRPHFNRLYYCFVRRTRRSDCPMPKSLISSVVSIS